MTRKEKIESLIQQCTNRKTLKLLNREWWREYFNEKKEEI